MGRDSRLNKNKPRQAFFVHEPQRQEVVPQPFATIERLVVPGHPDHFIFRLPAYTPNSNPHVHQAFHGGQVSICPTFHALANALSQLGQALCMDEPPNPIAPVEEKILHRGSGLVDAGGNRLPDTEVGTKVGVYNSPLHVEMVDAQGEPWKAAEDEEPIEVDERDFGSAHGAKPKRKTILDFGGSGGFTGYPIREPQPDDEPEPEEPA